MQAKFLLMNFLSYYNTCTQYKLHSCIRYAFKVNNLGMIFASDRSCEEILF